MSLLNRDDSISLCYTYRVCRRFFMFFFSFPIKFANMLLRFPFRKSDNLTHFHRMDDVEYLWQVLLTCDAVRKEDILNQLVSADRQRLISLLKLPKNAEERFRVYDLLIRIQPDGKELLQHVLDECQDDSDPLTQLAAIQFVYDHHMRDIDNFIDLFNKNLDNPLILGCVAQTVASMIMDSPDPTAYADTISIIIEKGATEDPDLLGTLPPLTRNETFAKMMLSSKSFKEWITEVPYKPELRTFNFYMRNLLTKYCDNPAELLVDDRAMVSAMTHPSPGLRCSIFEHIAVMTPYFKQKLLEIPRMAERLFDASMDTTQDEALARRKAIAALGLDKPQPDGNGPSKQRVEDIGPDLMVI